MDEKQKIWDNYFLTLCHAVSEKSKDPSTKSGAILVSQDNEILMTGFNGFPRGVEDTEERLNDRSLKYPLVVHAEANYIAIAAKRGISTNGLKLYCNWHPCNECAKLIAQSGIKEVIIDSEYNTSERKERWGDAIVFAEIIFKESGVIFREI